MVGPVVSRTASRMGRVASRLPPAVADPLWGELLKLQLRVGLWRLVPVDPLRQVYRQALDVMDQHPDGVGSFLEFGVFAGTSLATMVEEADRVAPGLRVIGFDSFRGLPASVAADEGGWQPGMFYCPRRVTEWNLRRQGIATDRVTLVEGWFDEVLTDELAEALDIDRVGIVQLDADAYSSTVPVLRWITPLLGDRAVLIFDDWYSGGNADEVGIGVQRAFEEWLASHPDLEAGVLAEYGKPVRDASGDLVERRAGKAFVITRR